MRPIREEYITANGVRLWTAQHGTGSPIIFCHGGPGACDNLEPVATLVGENHITYRYDQRGCGRSEASEPFTVETFLEDLEALRIHWQQDRWIVIGHSWGASLALAYALTHPERVTGLVMISAFVGEWDGTEFQQAYEARLSPAEKQRLEQIVAERKTATGSRLQQLREEQLQIKLRTDLANPDEAIALPEYPCPPNFDLNRVMNADWSRYCEATNFYEWIRQSSVKALVIHGNGDPRPARGPQRIADLLPQGSFASIPDAGHYPWLENPDSLRHILNTFLISLAESGIETL